MYEKVNITENHLRVLGLFTRGFVKRYYIREVSKLLRISPRTAQLILDDLEKKGVLESELMGKIRTYKLKFNSISRGYIIFAEQHKKINFSEKNELISEILSKLKPYSTGISSLEILAIFGSYAKGTQKKDSDLDIFIVGQCNKSKYNRISKLYGIDINVKTYAILDRALLEKDPLLKEVINNHVIISGVEQFIEIVMKNE